MENPTGIRLCGYPTRDGDYRSRAAGPSRSSVRHSLAGPWLLYAETWFTPYYFSVVTFTTLGFGDVIPACWQGELLVTIEVILGYVTLGLLISILANKVARRA